MERILLSFVGNRDPYSDADPGPVLSLLGAREFTRVILFCNGSEYVEKARTVETIAKEHAPGIRFNFVSLDLNSPIDHEEIYRELRSALQTLRPTMATGPHSISVLLDPGTPPMQTTWFLLVMSGQLDAELLQGVPARFAGGAYKARTIELDRDLFPGLEVSQKESATEGSDGSPETGTVAEDTGVDYARQSRGTIGGTAEGPWIQAGDVRIVGQSPAFTDVLEKAQRVAQYNVSVVIRGETGTGKEVIARLIHRASPRAREAFIAINCAAITKGLEESEFFGHEKGAFTGADRDRLGQFRAAHGGTVFLDEVGDLPLETQAKLLRVLEDHTVTPVGSQTPIAVDIRVLAATNRDLEDQIREGTFRRDLYERLAQVTVRIPPLRERADDVPHLLRHFVEQWNSQYHEEKGLSDEAVAMVLDYPWPGNVRELQNAVKSICAMGQSSSIGPELLPGSILSHFDRPRPLGVVSVQIPPEGLDVRAVLHDVERGYYEEALRLSGGNAEQAAKLLGINGPAFRKAARDRLGISYGSE